ncbi:GNAT family N-acetyltransferase [Aquabacterium sp.]|uniref:GNAT family N-acetyltransferase n=1 Tax=Aquabacterium sp. TaxID=1872578 RepID=UPI0035B1E456
MDRHDSSSIHIGRMGPADLSAYKTLRDEGLRLHPDAFDNDFESEHARPPESFIGRLGLSEPLGGTFMLGAWSGRELVAALALERQSLQKLRHSAELNGMVVRPDHRGKGLAELLVKACIEESRKALGLEQITLKVSTSSTSAIRVYERAGFQPCGVMPHAIKLVGRGSQVQYFDKLSMVLILA